MPTFHHDIAYLKPEKWYTEKATTILDDALQLLEKDANYTFTVEQAYFFAEYWEQHPDKHEKIKRYIREKRLVFDPGFWSVPDMCMPSGESIFQNATYGRRFLKETVDASPRAVLIADCWGHHAQLPQILKSCGYDYYIFSRCMEYDFEKENFRWIGLDGTEMPTHWMSRGYAGVLFPNEAPTTNAEELHWESASREGFLKLYNQMGQYCDEDPRMVPVGGDMTMPAESALDIVPKWQQDPAMPYMAFSTFSDAMDAIDFSEKEVYTEEFVSCLKGSFSTNIRIKMANRKLEQDLYGLEVLSVLKKRNIDFTSVWKTALKNQFHDIICGTICDEALVQAYDEYKDAFHQMEQKREELSAHGELAKFNSLPFSVTELCGNTKYVVGGFAYAEKEELTCQACSIPGSFENQWYFAELATDGFITKLVERTTGKVLFEQKEIPFGSLLLEADSGDNWVEFEYPWELDAQHTTNVPDPYDRSVLSVHPKTKLRSVGVQNASAEMLSDGSLRITQTGSLDYWMTKVPFSVTVTLSKSSPRIDYHTEFDCNNNRIRLRVAFPTELEGSSVRHQIPYGMVERGEGTQPLEYLMDQQDNTAGLALINRGLPANNTENGIMMLTIFRSVAMEYKCNSALSYNLGEHIACDYAVVPHATQQDSLLWEQALAFQRPLIDTTKEELLPISIENAQISAMREDEGAVFIRLYNGLPDATRALVHLPEEFSTYIYTDGCMNAVSEPINIKDNCIMIHLDGFKIQGIKLYRRS